MADEIRRNPGREIKSVVIPAYRCETTIAGVIDHIPEWIDHVIVVDDSSPDSTSSIVKEVMKRDDRVHLIQHSRNQGVGGAVLSGYREAVNLGSDIVIKMDSDDQMDPACLTQLIKPIQRREADYTKGNRFLRKGEIRTMPSLRRVGNLGLSFLTKLASGYWNIFDASNGYTAISTEVIRLLDPAEIDKRYFFETSMLIELGICGAVVRDIYIPVRYGAGTSSLSEWRTLVEFPPKLLRGLVRRVIMRYYMHDFTAVALFLTSGMALTLFGLIWGIAEWIRFSSLGVAAPTGTIMIAVLPLILGVQLLLQAIVMDIQNVPKEVLQRQDD